MLSPEKQAAIVAFLPKLQEQVKNDYLGWGKNSEFVQKNVPVLTYKEGQRFVKIVSSKFDGTSVSVFGFIEKETGLLWKAAGWKAPALNFPRGNIADADISKIRWTGIS